jgi:DNA-binding beta-propeller fold protein YncE
VRRNRAVAATLVWLLVLGAVAAGGFWFWTRPVVATVSASPSDCTIESCDTSGTGSLELADLPAGTYDVRVARAGFSPLEGTIEVTRFGDNAFSFALEPEPQRVTLTAHPDGATCRILRDGEGLLAGTDGLEGAVPAGDCTVEVALAGYNTYARELFLDRETTLEVWLDPEGQVVKGLGIIECAGAPKGVAITPDGEEAWATILDGPPSVEIFDMETLQLIDSIDLGEYGAVEITFSSDGRHAYATQMETARVFEIDVATRTVLRTMETGSAWSKVVELSPDGTTAFVANWSGDDISEIDLATGELRRRLPTTRTPRGLYVTPDSKTLYVAGFGSGDLQRIDLATGETTTLFEGGGALRHIVGDPERGLLYISDMAEDVIWLHDIASGTTTKFVDTDEKPNTIALSPDRTVLFVSCRGENNSVSYYIPGPEWGTVLLFDTATGNPLDAIVGGNQCTALDVSDDGTRLLFSDFLDSRMRLYEIPDHATLVAGDGGRWDEHFEDLVK